jgi:GT2 family glycosyltransferase
VEIVESMDLPNLKLYHRPDLGQASNSNFGVKKATGSLIKFLDSDDLLDRDCISRMVQKYEENPNRLVFGEWHYFVGDVSHIRWNHADIYKDYSVAMDWYVDVHRYAGSMLAAWMWLIPRKIIEKAGPWDERLTITNDLEFSTRLVINSDGIGFAKGAKHYYRKGITAAMTSKMGGNIPEKTATSVFIGLNKAWEEVKKKEDSPRIRLVFANLFQKWIYLLYPGHLEYVHAFEKSVAELGGSTLKPAGGRVFTGLIKVIPWKGVRYMQHILYATVWKPVLVWKSRKRLKKQFNDSVDL